MNSVIECKNLTHYYGDRLIYDNLSFSVPEGKILGLLGKNGTGKTTTINIINGYLEPRKGECLLFGENVRTLPSITKQRIALLIEGHIQYAFMNIQQIEKFYSAFYPKWNKDIYYQLMSKLHVSPKQQISRMSCGQRSQVALGLILAQNADLLILDDFSLGLDPGYRRLFIDYLREYAKGESKTVFITSHIIQDMEQLIDDCIILDYGKILIQKSVKEILDNFTKYVFTVNGKFNAIDDKRLYHTEQTKNRVETHSFLSAESIKELLQSNSVDYSDFTESKLSLEDAFIGLTGKY